MAAEPFTRRALMRAIPAITVAGASALSAPETASARFLRLGRELSQALDDMRADMPSVVDGDYFSAIVLPMSKGGGLDLMRNFPLGVRST